MKQLTQTLSLIILIQTGLVCSAHAARVAHRPWMAGRSHATARSVAAESPAQKETSKAVVKSGTKGDQIAEQASRYKGTKYRFGGESKLRGFDCSGLVRRVYNDLNLEKLPRTSGQLYKMGDPIHLSELRPGDLVFFKNTYKRGVSHVGVYAGNNRFIHAQNRRHGVTMTSLADPYYQLHYAGARRLY